ncbi:MAG: hypothetical protein V4773_04910 [Verrucomicrobiota bacterium]
MADFTSTLQYTIDLRANSQELEAAKLKFEELAARARKATEAKESLKYATERLQNAFKIGNDAYTATGASLTSVTTEVLGLITASSKLAIAADQAGRRVGLSAEGYQALADRARDTNVDLKVLLDGMKSYRDRLSAAVADPRKASMFDALRLSASELSKLPIESQLGRIATAIGSTGTESERAASATALLGKDGADLLPVLDALRTKGFDELKSTLEQTRGLLKNDVSAALVAVGERAEVAKDKITVSLSALNLKTAETKAQMLELLAWSGGTLGSGLQAAMAGSVGVALQKTASALGVDAAVINKMSGLGKALASPFGAAFALAAGAFIISELERVLLESDVSDVREGNAARARLSSIDANLKAMRGPADIEKARVEIEKRVAALEQIKTLSGQHVSAGVGGASPRAVFTQDQDFELKWLKAKQTLLKSAAAQRLIESGREADDAAARKRSEEATAKAAELAAIAKLKDDEESLARQRVADGERAKAMAVANDRIQAALTLENYKLTVLEAEADAVSKNTNLVGEARLAELAGAHERIRAVLVDIIKLKIQEAALLPSDGQEKLVQQTVAIAALQKKLAGVGMTENVAPAKKAEGNSEPATAGKKGDVPVLKSAERDIDDKYSKFLGGENDKGERRLSVPDAPRAGMQSWVMALGSEGEQVAKALEGSLGATVASISDGIKGWITGAKSFSATMGEFANTILKTFLDLIVKMGVQWVVNQAIIKMGMVGVEATADTLRAGRVIKENAAEAATLPAKTAGAAASSISSFGLAAALGVAALVAAMAMFGGFADGGYTGPGGKYQPAGLVHRGEVVWSQADISAAGGLANVEALRTGGGLAALDLLELPAPMFVSPVAAPAPVAASMAAVGGLGGAASAKQPRMIAIVPDMHSARALQRDPNFENVIVDVVQRRRGEILG